MGDLRDRFAELDLLDVPDLRTATDARIANLSGDAPEPNPVVPPLVPRWRGPLIAAGTAVATLVVVGAAVLLVRVEPTGVTDTPSTVAPTTIAPPATTEPDTPATTPDEPIGPQVATEGVEGVWQMVAIGEPWVEWIADVEALPDGGYVAVASEPSPWSVIWSPDGLAWHDGDPNGQVPTQTKRAEGLPGVDTVGDHLIAVTADRVVILNQSNTAVLVGDPRTGAWQPITLDRSGLTESMVPLAVAGNDREVLVVHAMERAETTELVMSVVDPAGGTAVGPMIPGIDVTDVNPLFPPVIGWVDGRWILMTQTWSEEADDHNTLWVSADATSWTQVPLPDGGSWDGGSIPDLGVFGGQLVTAPSGAIVQRAWMGGGDTWYSPDGIEWRRVREGFSEGATYSDTFGFVMSPSGEILLASDDGKVWNRQLAASAMNGWRESVLAASGSTVLQLGDVQPSLWLWSVEPLPPPPTTVTTVADQTTPTLGTVSGEQHSIGEDATEEERFNFVETFAADWADAWLAGDAARIADLFSDNSIYVDDTGEHHGPVNIESALQAHFERISYDEFDNTGFDESGFAIDTPDGSVHTYELYWTWGGTVDGDTVHEVPASTRFLINYNTGTIVQCLHNDWA